MNLKTYLRVNRITYQQFAAMGGWHKQTVNWWANGDRIPIPENAIKIESLTCGAVTVSELRMPNNGDLDR